MGGDSWAGRGLSSGQALLVYFFFFFLSLGLGNGRRKSDMYVIENGDSGSDRGPWERSLKTDSGGVSSLSAGSAAFLPEVTESRPHLNLPNPVSDQKNRAIPSS